jgi:gliotoxin/aspirochlorine biosynthesis peptide synthetase
MCPNKSLIVRMFVGNSTASGIKVSIGRPLPRLVMYILDHHKCLVPQHIVGEIYIAGEQVAHGYWSATPDQKDASRFTINPFSRDPHQRIMYRTSDFGYWNEDMKISYVGRVDNQVKVRGFRVELEEIESTLLAAGKDKVQSAAAIAMDNDGGDGSGGGLRIIGVVTPEDVDVAALRARLAFSLPSYSRPSQILAVSELPMSSM